MSRDGHHFGCVTLEMLSKCSAARLRSKCRSGCSSQPRRDGGSVSAGKPQATKPKPLAFVHRERHQQEQMRTLAERNGAVGRVRVRPPQRESSTANRRGAFIVTGTQCSHPSAILPRPAMDIEVKLKPTALAPREARRFVARELAALG